MKLAPSSTNKKTYISFGNEIRFQYFLSKNEQWGDAPYDSDGYVLTRWLAHSDLHVGKNFRTFVQLQSSLANSRIDPNPVENNPLELHQAFVDIKPIITENSILTFRIGRQELMYGSQRLISVRDGPNNRQLFDALRAIYSSSNCRTDVFYSHYVVAKPNVFDDSHSKNVRLWGVYHVREKLPIIENIDLYYLGLIRRNAIFNDGKGKELRHSMGTRVWNSKGDWKFDIEGLYQFGKFAGKRISAWTTSINTSYKFNFITFKPEVGLKTAIISGDNQKGNNILHTFNPLFPRGAYFGLAALIGPANLVDVHPSASLELSEKIKFEIDYDLFWRHSKHDGLYAANVFLVYPDGNSSETKIGNQLTSAVIYTPAGFIYFRGEFVFFNAGPYLKEVGSGEDILFTGITIQVKF